MLFGSSDRVLGNGGPTGMGAYLLMSTAGTTVASTYSLSFVVSDVPSRNGDDHTKMNNTKTGNPSAPSSRRPELEDDTPDDTFPDQMYSICHSCQTAASARTREVLASSDNVRK